MRWHVAYGGYPSGWEHPFLKTDDPEEAIAAYDAAKPGSMQTVAIFDYQNGEGEPLSDACVADIVADEQYTADVAKYLKIDPRDVR